MLKTMLTPRREIHVLENHVVRLDKMISGYIRVYFLDGEWIDTKLIEGKDFKITGHRNVLLFNNKIPCTKRVLIEYEYNLTMTEEEWKSDSEPYIGEYFISKYGYLWK